MIIVTGTARFGAGGIERLRDAMAANIEATRAEEGLQSFMAELAQAKIEALSVQMDRADFAGTLLGE